MYVFDLVFIKFVIVGTINTIVGTTIMLVLYNIAGFGYWISSAISYLLTSILSFFLNKYFTFSIKEWQLKTIIVFALNILCSYLIAYSAVKPFIYFMLNNYNKKIQDNISMISGVCLFTFLNYLGQRFVVFKVKKQAE